MKHQGGLENDVREIFRRAALLGASDIHLSAEAPPMVRVKGRLVPLEGASPLDPSLSQRLCYAVMTDALRKTLEERRSVDFSFRMEGVGSFRANVFYKSNTVAGAFRRLPERIPDLDGLGFLPEALSVIKGQMLARARGLVLVTGPTGSGKSTTLASMIHYLLKTVPGLHVVTIEDPIEYRIPASKGLVSQREVGTDVGSFREALRYVLRQDPDVVMIGEMRDLESIEAALTIAETGHLTFATLHTGSVKETISRIVDAFPADKRSFIRVQLADVIAGVIAQRLVPGRDRRHLAAEVMCFDQASKAMIRDGTVHQIDVDTRGGVSLDTALKALVAEGKVDLQEAGRFFAKGLPGGRLRQTNNGRR